MTKTPILEIALLNVRAGQEAMFEAAFAQAKSIIAQTPGFMGLSLRPCLESQSRYLLSVEWRSLEDNTIGFRQAPHYQEWKALLHHFYDPFPVVEHYAAPILEQSAS